MRKATFAKQLHTVIMVVDDLAQEARLHLASD